MKTIFPGHTLLAGVLTTLFAFAVTVPSSTMHAADNQHAAQVVAGNYASTADAWKAAQASVKEIETLVAAKDLKPVHVSQEKLAGALQFIQQSSGAGVDKARLS